ncbi:MAG: hypothetical protein WBQ55_09575 [Xanthobacteraceae bacterium]
MKFSDEITSEMFERWLWRLAILLAVSPILTAVCAILFFQDRIFIIASGAIGFVMGLTLMRASFGLKINPRRAFLLIEWSFYLFVASTLIDLIYWCWTNPEFFNSVLGILPVLVRLIAAIIVLWWIGEVIYRVKNSYASPATYRTN